MDVKRRVKPLRWPGVALETPSYIFCKKMWYIHCTYIFLQKCTKNVSAIFISIYGC